MKPNWFIGWPIAAPLLERAGEAPPAVRPFAASDLHVTLAFLGACGEERARAGFAMISTAAEPLQVGAVELFGHPRRGTALSATLTEGRDVLAERIGAGRDGALEAAGDLERSPAAGAVSDRGRDRLKDFATRDGGVMRKVREG